MTTKSKFRLVVSIPVIAAVGFYLCWINGTHNLTLKAEDALAVYATENEAMNWRNAIPFARLQGAYSVPVVSCNTSKEYQSYQVLLPDGQTGYVFDGKYRLERDDKPGTCS